MEAPDRPVHRRILGVAAPGTGTWRRPGTGARARQVSLCSATVCASPEFSKAAHGASRCESQPDMAQLPEALSSLPESTRASLLGIIKEMSRRFQSWLTALTSSCEKRKSPTGLCPSPRPLGVGVGSQERLSVPAWHTSSWQSRRRHSPHVMFLRREFRPVRQGLGALQQRPAPSRGQWIHRRA